jgi:hypothetical protein
LLWWFADQFMAALPPHEDGLSYPVADSMRKGERTPQHAVAQMMPLR